MAEPEPYFQPADWIPTPITELKVCSLSRYAVWARPAPLSETILVIPTLKPFSSKNFWLVSLVILFPKSLDTTLPIVLDTAWLNPISGSDDGLSLSTCGYKSLTGWLNLYPVNGDTLGFTS